MKIYIDFDSTLVDFTKAWINWLKKKKFIKIRSQDILHWDWISQNYGDHVNEYWKTEGIYGHIAPIPGAAEFIIALKKLYGENNIILISNSARNMTDEKDKYANLYFQINPNNFLHVAKKWEYTSDGILIDDAPHNIVEHILNNNMPGILFNYRNKYGWSNFGTYIKVGQFDYLTHKDYPLFDFLKKCLNYSECLTTIEKFRESFHLE